MKVYPYFLNFFIPYLDERVATGIFHKNVLNYPHFVDLVALKAKLYLGDLN